MENKRNSKQIAFMVAIIAILGIGAYSQLNKSHESKSVRAASLPIIATLPEYIAIDYHLFEKEGLDYQQNSFRSSNDMVNAIVAKQIDILPSVSIVPIIHLEIQSPGKVRLFSHTTMTSKDSIDSIVIKNESSIKTLKDLKGKKIGVFPGTSATNMLKFFLKKNNVAVQEIHFIPLPPPAQYSSLESGAIDALFSYEPITTIATASTKFRTLQTAIYSSLLSPSPFGCSVIAREYEKNNPQTASKVIRVIEAANQHMFTNRKEAETSILNHMKVPGNITKEVHFVGVTPVNQVDVTNLQDFIDLLYDIGEIPEKIDAHRLTDPTPNR